MQIAKIQNRIKTCLYLFTLVTAVYAINTKQDHGRFLGVPFDFRWPTLGRLKKRFWNPDDGRIFTPHFFGVGWSINLYQAMKQFGLVDQDENEG